MNVAVLDPYRDIASPIHRLDARLKVIGVLVFIVAVNLTPLQGWAAFGIYAALLAGVIALARLSPGSVLGRSMLALPFVLMAAIGLPFVREGRALVALNMLGWQVSITDVGVLRFASVMANSWLSVSAAITLIYTTHCLDIMRALRSLGVPLVRSAIILLMYRYMFVLVEETQCMIRAREARSAEIDAHKAGRSVWWRAQVTGRMIGTLFLRTYERSERIYNAMLARGYTGEIRVLRQTALSPCEVAVGGLGAAALLGVAILAQWVR